MFMNGHIKTFITLGAVLFCAVAFPRTTQARTIPLFAATSAAKISASPLIATQSAIATPEAELATPSALVVQKIQEKTDKDITQSNGKTKDTLIEILDQNPIGPLSWNNFLQHALRRAITNGLAANIVVLILLFPLITSVISFSRHVIGLKGFGVYTPAVLSVAFVSTGIINGILLFVIILGAAIFMKAILKRLKLQYLPRTAMLLWGVSIVMLAVLVLVSFAPINGILAINIFPILIIMLLTENFMESQLASSQKEATELTIETLLIATICSLLIGANIIQKYALLQPEILLFIVAVVNIVVGRYSGLRLIEWIRFRSIIDQ